MSIQDSSGSLVTLRRRPWLVNMCSARMTSPTGLLGVSYLSGSLQEFSLVIPIIDCVSNPTSRSNELDPISLVIEGSGLVHRPGDRKDSVPNFGSRALKAEDAG